MIMYNSINKRVDYVLRIVDDYTQQPINSGLIIRSNEVNLKPIKKSDGLYVITNLQKNIGYISITSEIYFDEIINILDLSIDKMSPIINIRLKTKAIYFRYDDGAIIKFKINAQDNKLLQTICIKAFINTNNYSEGQVVEDVLQDTNYVKAKQFYDELLPGNDFFIKDELNDRGEYIRILYKNTDKFVLFTKVHNNYSKGSKICRAFITKCDEYGNVVIYFRRLLRNNANIDVDICVNGYIKKINTNIESTGFLDLGKITL